MANRLAQENSPYLLQHKDNPVDWYPWGEEALEKARAEGKPIFLSIGYAACHWCHVMEHESFEDPETAAVMNEHFVNIKVDREERPDLDNIYMNAVVAMTGQGGWPMSVFLTPEGKPFYGGTYFPPVRRHQLPSFVEVLRSVREAWNSDQERVDQIGQQLVERLQESVYGESRGARLDEVLLERAALSLAQIYDWQNGGWGRPPKFPQPMTISFLLRRSVRGDKFAQEMLVHALHAMAKGGMYDVVGGGFHRYSVDADWRVPHFEKMLYDNAQLAQVYLHAYLDSGDRSFRRVAEQTIDYVIREMSNEEGGFFSSLDADSEGEEGIYYTWTEAEIREVLQEAGDADLILEAYGVTEAGNFEGRTVLQRVKDDAALADRFELPVEEIERRLESAHTSLLTARAARVRPDTDDKVLVSWNGMMLVAVAEAARYLGRADYLDMAIRNARFIWQHLRPDGRLQRSWRNGIAQHNAYLEDYAALIRGLLSLYQSDPNPHWFQAAQELAGEMIAHFQDESGGFFDTRDDHETLVFRPKDLQDNATPSGNALAAQALLELAAYTGTGQYRDLAERSISQVAGSLLRFPTAFGQWLCAADFAVGPVFEVAILGKPDAPQTQDLVRTLWETIRLHTVAAIADHPPSPDSPPLLIDRPLLDQKPTAYVCQNFVCHQPVNTPEALRKQLVGTARQPNGSQAPPDSGRNP